MQPVGIHIPEAQKQSWGGGGVRGMDPGAQEWRTRMSPFMPCGPGHAHCKAEGGGGKGITNAPAQGSEGVVEAQTLKGVITTLP